MRKIFLTLLVIVAVTACRSHKEVATHEERAVHQDTALTSMSSSFSMDSLIRILSLKADSIIISIPAQADIHEGQPEHELTLATLPTIRRKQPPDGGADIKIYGLELSDTTRGTHHEGDAASSMKATHTESHEEHETAMKEEKKTGGGPSWVGIAILIVTGAGLAYIFMKKD